MKTLKFVATLMVCISTTVVFAQTTPKNNSEKRENLKQEHAEMQERLQLTPEQQEKIKEIRKNNQAEMKAIKEANKNADKATQREAMLKQKEKNNEQIKSVLNETQKAEFDKIKAEKRAEHAGKHKKGKK
ncbi:MAG: hypothetical protein H3C45_10280 [Bacteroidia bacterium]|nr:hypothetical protein [Bacteroidia bacterium]MCC7532841.1 hypothetical protein [Bacteroidia bacterium]